MLLLPLHKNGLFRFWRTACLSYETYGGGPFKKRYNNNAISGVEDGQKKRWT